MGLRGGGWNSEDKKIMGWERGEEDGTAKIRGLWDGNEGRKMEQRGQEDYGMGTRGGRWNSEEKRIMGWE